MQHTNNFVTDDMRQVSVLFAHSCPQHGMFLRISPASPEFAACACPNICRDCGGLRDPLGASRCRTCYLAFCERRRAARAVPKLARDALDAVALDLSAEKAAAWAIVRDALENAYLQIGTLTTRVRP